MKIDSISEMFEGGGLIIQKSGEKSIFDLKI